MKKIISLISFLLFSSAFYAQTSTKILVAGAARMNISRLIIHDPLFPKRAFENSNEAFTPGFGMLIQPYQSGIFHLLFQLGYEERGSGEAYYFETSHPPEFLHIYDRFRCVYSDILLRAQSKKGFYFGLGGSICKPINGYYRNHSSTFLLPQGAIILEPNEVSAFTYGITVAAGKNISGKAEVELNVTYDQTPVIFRTDAKIYIQAASFTLRYYFRRADK